jgi:cytosine/adenosine deaminase-related metal-dependent hydrolase
MDENYTVLKNAEIIFDEEIIEIGRDLRKCEEEIDLGKNSVIMPALINTHTHLEYSSNKTMLEYGDFMLWLDSVIEHREDLFVKCKGKCFKNAVKEMKKSGICAFGEISSTGDDLKYIKHSPLKIVHFNEIVGTNPGAVDMLFSDFLARLEESKRMENEKFKTAISIHSPYSVHPLLMDKVLEIAKKENIPVQAHFMESRAERKWLDEGEGEFKIFFEKHFKNAKPLIKPKEFLKKFEGLNATFVHCVYANDEELELIKKLNAHITHCPVSNRLLNVGLLDLERVKNNKIEYSVATDGLSSNFSLNLFKEIRAALLMHKDLHPKYLAKDLLKAVTINAAASLGLNNGSLQKGKKADIITFRLPDAVENLDLLPLQIILHTTEVENLYVNGEKV